MDKYIRNKSYRSCSVKDVFVCKNTFVQNERNIDSFNTVTRYGVNEFRLKI